jgi:hypothetical protein
MTTKGDASRGAGKSSRWRHPANRHLDRRRQGERIADRVTRVFGSWRFNCPCVREVGSAADDLLTELSRDL